MNKYIEYIKNNDLGLIYTDKSFKDITSLNVGGRISLLFYPSTTQNFIQFYRYYIKYNDYKIFIIGNGSNVLASDKDYNGIVISLKKINEIKIINNYVTVSSGFQAIMLSKICKSLNLSGGEFLSVIPATIGGIVTMNASSYDNSISDIVSECLCIDKNGKIKWIKNKEMGFKYRSSVILKEDFVLLKVRLKFKKGKSDEIQKLMNSYITLKKNTQPLDKKSAGSVYKNPPGLKAWKIIKDLNIKNKYDDIEVSSKHANFIINKGNGNASDIFLLVNDIKAEAKQKYNINLECEWTIINFE